MSLSKVIKDAKEFVPEQIVSAGEFPATVWGSIINESGKLSGSETARIEHEKTGDKRQGEDTHLLDEDFSSPLANQKENGSIKAPQHENRQQDIPAVDINAIAEEHYNLGVQAGIEQAQQEFGASSQTLLSLCEQLSNLRETILQNSSAEIRQMILVIAEKIIRHSVANQQQTIIDTVNDALSKALKSDDFVISVNPDDLEVVSSHSSEFIASINGLKKIVIKPDQNIDRGGCYLESSTCTVDATVVSQLKVIAETLGEE